jgi:ketosteroid isomerase-like protein
MRVTLPQVVPPRRAGYLLVLVLLLGAASDVTHSQAQLSPGALTQTITALDARLFNAYNQCDLSTLGSLVSDDLEFYHDRDGLSVGRKTFLDSIQNNICGKVRRELVAGTLEVYALGGDRALEMGVHRFHHPGRDETEPIGEARFSMIWRRQGDGWRLTRVISYGHGALPK